MNKKLTLLLLIILFSNCKNDEYNSFTETIELIYNFQNDQESWEGDFADYPIGEESFYQLKYEYSNLPAPLNPKQGSLKLSGNNHSDDLFMFIRKKVDKLQPNTSYKISFQIEFASNIADNMFGVGGSPGEGVAIKAGATNTKPQKVSHSSGHYRMNIDKNNQSASGSDMKVIGDFSNDTDQNEYTLKGLKANDLLVVSTNNKGELWLVIGTDSGFEATTTIYYNTIKIKMEKQ